MKRNLSNPGAIVATLVVLALVGCQRQGATADHEHPPGTPADHTHPGEHTHEADTTPVPGTLSGVWAEIETHRQEIDRLIATGTFGEVISHAFRIRTLVAAMEPMSGQYASAQGPLTDAVQRVDQITNLMHDAADGNDLEGTRNQKQRLDSVLDYIRGLYPAGVLAAP